MWDFPFRDLQELLFLKVFLREFLSLPSRSCQYRKSHWSGTVSSHLIHSSAKTKRPDIKTIFFYISSPFRTWANIAPPQALCHFWPPPCPYSAIYSHILHLLFFFFFYLLCGWSWISTECSLLLPEVMANSLTLSLFGHPHMQCLINSIHNVNVIFAKVLIFLFLLFFLFNASQEDNIKRIGCMKSFLSSDFIVWPRFISL